MFHPTGIYPRLKADVVSRLAKHLREKKMIYLVNQHNRAAYRKQIEELLCGRETRSLCEFEPDRDGAGLCISNKVIGEDSVCLLQIDMEGNLTSGLLLDLRMTPVVLKFMFPQCLISAHSSGSARTARLGGAAHHEGDPLSGELVVGLFEYALAIGVSEIDVSGNFALINAAVELECWFLSQSGSEADRHASLLLAISYDDADRIREFHELNGPVLVCAPEPPPYAANENRRLRIAFAL
jgi:hypothetical protein